MDEFEAILARAKTAPLSEEDREKLETAIHTLFWLTGELERKHVSIARLQTLLFGARNEKTSQVLAIESEPDSPESASQAGEKEASHGVEPEKKDKPKGHGRNGAAAYAGAEKIHVPHESLASGALCPACKKGRVYNLAEPRTLVRVKGQAPLTATVWELEALRCNLCDEVFAAKAPEGIGEEKYDESAASMIALLKYGSGLPFNRLEKLEGNLGIPLPAATQWEIVEEAAERIAPAHDELIRQAAQGEVIHHDDTTMKILALGGEKSVKEAEERVGEPTSSERTGVFTSGIVARREGHDIALFFTGRKHAGENLAAVLKKRASELPPPIQMCDGLSRNVLPDEFETLLAHCVAHGRRKFVELVDLFPEECRYVILSLRAVYKTDAEAREQNLSPQKRLALHQAQSRPVMDELEQWMNGKMERHEVEPNSALGQAIEYMLKRWKELTLFLREPGAPLDNNLCERALKKAILHRKNALFYKTEKGARVGDLFMSLTYTAELAGVSAFDYLTELQKHAEEVRRDPAAWMPWNYRAAIAGLPQADSAPT